MRRTRLQRFGLTFLAVLVILTGWPAAWGVDGSSVAHAATSPPIELIGFGDYGQGPDKPLIYGDPTLTISGQVVAQGINPENIRFKILESREDYSTVKPSVDGDRFTFSNIPLVPDRNTIVFYQKAGSIETTLLTFYVYYNDTPLITNLMVNDQALPPLGGGQTVIQIVNPDRLTLVISGQGKNVDRVEIKSDQVNAPQSADVVSGVFSALLPAKVGKNVLEFRAYKGNKEVYYIQREVVVTLASSGGNLLYDVVAGGGSPASQLIDLIPAAVTEVPVQDDGAGKVQNDLSDTTNGGFAKISGTLILNYSNTADRELVGFKILAERGSETQELASGPAQAGKTSYSWSGSLAGLSISGGPWTIKAQYIVRTYDDPTDKTRNYTDNAYDIDVHTYQIRLFDKNEPRFLRVTEAQTAERWGAGSVHDVPALPLVLKIEAMNMSNIGNLAVQFDGQTLTKDSDYSLPDWSYNNTTGFTSFTLNIDRLPAKNGRLKLTYSGGSNGTVEIEFQLNVLLAPYVTLHATVNGKTQPFDRVLTLQNAGDLTRLSGKVYNYILKPQGASGRPSNLDVQLNGRSISGLGLVTKTDDESFAISVTSTEFKLNPGSNTLKVILADEPRAEFTYEIRLYNEAVSTIGDIVLKVEQNGKTVDLRPEAGETRYRTSALYLAEFSFKVISPKDQQILAITKGGDVIAQYKYDGSKWTLDDNVLDTYRSSLNSYLRAYAEPGKYNFPSTVSSNTFKAGLTASQYGLITDAAQRIAEENRDEAVARLPLTLRRFGQTIYTISLMDGNGALLATATVYIERTQAGWKVLAPLKAKPTDAYPIVNSNAVEVKVFAEKATKVLIGKNEATTANTTTPDYVFDEKIGDLVPKTYYVFTATAPLKAGLNKIPLQLVIDGQTYKDEIVVYNANTPLTGAEYIDVLGKNVKFTAFDKQLTLTFPKGTVLVEPPANRADDEYIDKRSKLYTDVPLYFALADRLTGQVIEPIQGSSLQLALNLPPNFIYASPLYFIDGGDVDAPGGRDPYARYDEGERKIGDAAPKVRTFRDRTYDNLIPSQRGTLTLSYDPSIVVQAANQLTVFYHDGRAWHNIGGVVDPKKHTITVPFIRFGYYMVMKLNQSFPDVVNHPFAQPAMEAMYTKGIMANYSGATFGANMTTSRGELATALVKALDLPINAGPYEDATGRYPLEPSFYDVRPTNDSWDYAYRYIETAARAGIVSGKQPGFFRPDDGVTRQEAAVMIARALNLKLPATPEAAKATLAKQFADTNQMNYYALQAIAAVTKAGLMEGSPVDPKAKKTLYTFNPQAPLTRAEMAVILQKVMIQMKKLPK
ncbi:MAG: S-layer homology domain-containing protein [Hydrogenibacillus sp.]|nr:S-layer homology domain-containing protein [Hydrogenibacillus sp.]